DCPRDLMLDRMPRLVLGYRRVPAGAQTLVAELRIRTGMEGITVIGIDDMACGAPARTIVPRRVVRSHEAQQRVQEARLLQAKIHGVRPQQGAQSPWAQEVLRGTSGRFLRIGQARFHGFFPSAFESAEYVPHLGDLPPGERIEVGKNPFLLCLFRCWLRDCLQPRGRALRAVTFSK